MRSNGSAGSTQGYDHLVTTPPQITVAETAPALAQAAARLIVEAAREAVAARGRFLVALAGGATPRDTYALLARPPLRDAMPWDRTWVFFGDERAVPPDHRESNYRMAYEALLAAVPLPLARVRRMRAEAEDQDAAAAEYTTGMLEVFAPPPGELPRFDLVLLGLGIDGHTASLFPGSSALRETQRWVVAVHAQAAAIPRRLTMTLPVFNAARRVTFLSAGSEKAKVVRSVLLDAAPLPAAMIRPHAGDLQWLLDRAAAALLDGAPVPARGGWK
jgi:6-phosphogluconolactonase